MLHLALEALDQGHCSTRFFFADFRKGFDLIDHRILIRKLSGFNIHNCLTRWVASFLQGRSQFTRIGNARSSTKVLCGGIPQGTKLGPILFAVMVNDLLSTWGPRTKFVDDLTVLEIIPRNSPSLMNFIVDDTQKFAVRNNMSLNPPKCKSMIIDFLHYNSCEISPILTGGSIVEQVTSFKLLGVFISNDLTWNIHCDYILKKSNKRLYILRQLVKCGLPPSDVINVYCTLIRPIVEYASVVFANLPLYLNSLIENIQKRALRIIYPNLSYSEALEHTGLLSLNDRRKNACQKFVDGIRPGNPIFPLIHGRSETFTAPYSLRSGSVKRYTKTVRTDRFSSFVTVRFCPSV